MQISVNGGYWFLLSFKYFSQDAFLKYSPVLAGEYSVTWHGETNKKKTKTR